MAAGTLTDDRRLRADGLFLAEGRFVVSRLLASPGWTVTDLFVTPPARVALQSSLDALPLDARPPVTILTPEALAEAGGFHFHQGCLARACRRPIPDVSEVAFARAPTGVVVVLDAVRDPDNVGAMFRSALALGAAGVVLGPGCADPYYRKTIRTSMAAVLTLPFASAAECAGAVELLSRRGFETVALTPDASTEPLPALAAVHRPGIALVVGSEDRGLAPDTLARTDRRVHVPMSPGVDSLNVATAVAVTLYALAHTPAR